ncbi:MAG TPA: hypothetical protein VIC84_12500, partial [Blastocatellia bacterium]
MGDQARAILGGMIEVAKNYVTSGKDRVMSWANSESRRLIILHFQYPIFNSQAKALPKNEECGIENGEWLQSRIKR